MGLRRDGDYGTCHHKKDKETVKQEGGYPDCLRKRSKQGHSRGELWESDWTVPQVYLVQHSHFSGGDIEVQRREEACPCHTRHPRNRTLDSTSKIQ